MASHHEIPASTVTGLRQLLSELEAQGLGDLIIEHLTPDCDGIPWEFTASSVYYSAARKARVVQLV